MPLNIERYRALAVLPSTALPCWAQATALLRHQTTLRLPGRGHRLAHLCNRMR